MIEEAEARRLIARFDDVERRYVQRYGPSSQARVFVLMEELVTIRFALLDATGPAAELLRRQRREVARGIQRLYDLSPFPEGPPPPVRILGGDPPVIEFDRAVFETKYASAAKSMRSEVVFLEDWKPEPQDRPVAYMYVVDDESRIRIWTRPFRMADLILGRNRATVAGVPVAHPMLVPERLRVRAAGEITPVFSDRVTGAVVNLKSGHFRPAPPAAAAVRDACAAAIGMDPAECDVLTVPPVPTTPPVPDHRPETAPPGSSRRPETAPAPPPPTPTSPTTGAPA
ncbi:hypothetical protein AB0E74_15035 [Streptomyces sp. NPDC030392]